MIDVAELFVVMGSVEVVVTEAVSVRVVALEAAAVNVIVTTTESPEPRVPIRSATMFPECVGAGPLLDTAETNVELVGKLSVRLTSSAGDGPWLVTVTV